MNISVRKFCESDVAKVNEIWNEVVKDGRAFPQIECLDDITGKEFFLSQSYTGIAENENGEIDGLYILHPNNVGRCSHICNASYAVKSGLRGEGIGEKLVCDCIKIAPKFGFKILQFNAVVKSNKAALHLYKKLGFTPLGTIPKGFMLDSGEYEDIIPHYIEV